MKDDDSHKKPRLTDKDAALWAEMTKDVDLMPGQTYQEGADTSGISDAPEESLMTKAAERTHFGVARQSDSASSHESRPSKSNDVDRRTMDRFRRGQMHIDSRIDLHGLSQIEAYESLKSFILGAYASGHRCVLVITGKGRINPSVIKAKTPDWLREHDVKNIILQTAQAQPKDGGGGALYVLLRRKR